MVRRKLLIGAGITVLVVLAGGLGYYQLVKAGILRYNKYDRRERGLLEPGAQAPDLALARFEGGTVRLSELWADKPVLLVFGSCT